MDIRTFQYYLNIKKIKEKSTVVRESYISGGFDLENPKWGI